MSNEDKRRRRDGSTTQLSVADLIARREAETQPIPVIRIDDVDDIPAEETVRFAPVKTPLSLSGRELHVAELLRREGRPADEERGGGMSMSRLVALASGGVVLCGSVAFGASQWLSSPDERPLADVRFDTRPAARATNPQSALDLSAAAAKQQQAPAPATTTDPTTQAPVAQQPAAKRPAQAPARPGTDSPTTESTPPAPTTPSESTNPPPPPPPETTTPPPTTTPPSDSVPPTSTTTPPSSSQPPASTPAPESNTGIGIGLALGKIIEPLGGFDFFAA